jgi:hypothetical protein
MLQTVWSNLYPDVNHNTIKNLYKDGYYVFRRKMHDSNKYYAYLKANKQVSSTETLTYPAFPQYLLPPNSVITELEKSPMLTLTDEFRKDNWNEIIGNPFCNIDDIDIKCKGYLTREEKLIKYLRSIETGDKDLYIYSLYIIEPVNDNTFFCCHLSDITKKHDGSYSKKSSKYSISLNPYTVKFQDGCINSEFGKHV